jgi:hypothetical protein
MSQNPSPLVGTRGKTPEELRMIVSRSKEIVEALHQKRAELEKRACEQARTPEELDELMEQVEIQLGEHQPSNLSLNDEQAALVGKGFPVDWWLPVELAVKWKTSCFPKKRSAKAKARWETQVKKAAFRNIARGRDSTGRRMLKQLAHDLVLLRQHNSRRRISGEEKEAISVTPHSHTSDDLKIDIGGFTYRHKSYPLSRQPLRLLRCFANARNMLLTHADIVKGVWANDYSPSESRVRGLVSELRTRLRKLLIIKSDPLPSVDAATWQLTLP